MGFRRGPIPVRAFGGVDRSQTEAETAESRRGQRLKAAVGLIDDVGACPDGNAGPMLRRKRMRTCVRLASNNGLAVSQRSSSDGAIEAGQRGRSSSGGVAAKPAEADKVRRWMRDRGLDRRDRSPDGGVPRRHPDGSSGPPPGGSRRPPTRWSAPAAPSRPSSAIAPAGPAKIAAADSAPAEGPSEGDLDAQSTTSAIREAPPPTSSVSHRSDLSSTACPRRRVGRDPVPAVEPNRPRSRTPIAEPKPDTEGAAEPDLAPPAAEGPPPSPPQPAPPPERTQGTDDGGGATRGTGRVETLAYVLVFAGEVDRAVALIDQATRLNPSYPVWYRRPSGMIHYFKGDYAAAAEDCQAWRDAEPLASGDGSLWLAAAQAMEDRTLASRETIAPQRRARPYSTTRSLSRWMRFADPEMRKAV
jgi:hypothetical protein